MRIAIVSDFFLDYVGGAQSSIFEQKASLEEAGHCVTLIYAYRSPRNHAAPITGVALPVTPLFTVPGAHLPVIPVRRALISRLSTFLVDNRIDVVHLQTEFGLAHAATTAAHNLGLPVVHTVHTFYWQTLGAGQRLVAPVVRTILQRITAATFPRQHLTSGAIGNVLRNLTLAMAARVDVVVSPSAHQGADLAAAGIAVPIDVVPNPIARSPRPAALLTPEKAAKPRVLWVARCEQEKRPIAFATAAIEALERTNEGFEIDFVGSGSLLPQVRELVAGHPRFHVLGSLGHGAVIDLMDGAALVALTSHGFDNQPMTIAEAVSRYRGVLFCDPKLREGLGDSGWLSATPDAPALADSLVDLVTHPDKLLALSVGAKRDSEVFSAATYVTRITAVYEHAARLRAAKR